MSEDIKKIENEQEATAELSKQDLDKVAGGVDEASPLRASPVLTMDVSSPKLIP